MATKKIQPKKMIPSDFSEDDNFPRPCKIKISYDDILQKITGKKEEEAIVSEGIPFMIFLGTIFSSYPEIELKYPPGALGFTVNGQPPDDFETLENGDEVFFTVGSGLNGLNNYHHG